MTVEIGPRQEKVSSRGEPTRLAFYDIGRILSVRTPRLTHPSLPPVIKIFDEVASV